jgi:hypothetical protein
VYFVGYSGDVKGYKLIQPHSNEIIIRRDVQFDENLLSCYSNSMFVPFLAYNPSSKFVSYSIPIVVLSYLGDDSEDENPPPLTHLPPNESIEHEPAPTPSLHRWVYSTREVVGDLSSHPSYQHWTHSHF